MFGDFLNLIVLRGGRPRVNPAAIAPVRARGGYKYHIRGETLKDEQKATKELTRWGSGLAGSLAFYLPPSSLSLRLSLSLFSLSLFSASNLILVSEQTMRYTTVASAYHIIYIYVYGGK